MSFNPQILRYDANHPLSHGYWRCTKCGNQFYSGVDGKALHKENCPSSNYHDCTYHFGPKQVQAIIRSAKTFGKNHNWSGIDLATLEQHFPELLS